MLPRARSRIVSRPQAEPQNMAASAVLNARPASRPHREPPLPRRRLRPGGEKVGLLGRRKSTLNVDADDVHALHQHEWLHGGLSEAKAISSWLAVALEDGFALRVDERL